VGRSWSCRTKLWAECFAFDRTEPWGRTRPIKNPRCLSRYWTARPCRRGRSSCYYSWPNAHPYYSLLSCHYIPAFSPFRLHGSGNLAVTQHRVRGRLQPLRKLSVSSAIRDTAVSRSPVIPIQRIIIVCSRPLPLSLSKNSTLNSSVLSSSGHPDPVGLG
jgi:hypothetical protein